MPQKLTDPHIIDVTSPATAVMFERIFGIDTAEFYKMRRLGSLPPNVFDKENPATYEQCFQWLMSWLKGRAAFRTNDTVEAQRIQATKVDKQREIKLMLENLEMQRQLVNINELGEILFSYATTASQQLNTLAKKFPKAQEDIDKIQANLSAMGKRLEAEHKQEEQEWIMNLEETQEDDVEDLEDFRDVPLELPLDIDEEWQ